MIVVFIALLPGLAVQIYTARDAHRTREHLMDEEALRLVRLVAAVQQRIIDSSELVLGTVAVAPSVQDRDGSGCHRLFANLIAATPRYNFAGLSGPDGHTICASAPVDPSADATDRPYFREALQTGGLAIGLYTIGRGSGQPSLHFAKVVRDLHGEVAGVAVLALSLEWLQQELQSLDLPSDVMAGITDRQGVLLARVPYDASRIGVSVLAENRFILQGRTNSLTDKRARDGREILVGYSPVDAKPVGLGIIVALDKATNFAAVTAGNRTNLALISTAGLLALMLTVLIGRRLISRPVVQLLDIAERWRTGDLAARSGLRADHGEFGRLGTAFDEMAATLQARERALYMALESTPDAVVVFDRAWRYTFMNAHAKALTGRDLIGQVLWDANPETVGTPLAAALLKAMQTGRPVQADVYSAALQRHLQSNAYPSEDGLTVFYRDLTEARRVENALRDSEERLRLATEVMQLGIRDINLITNEGVWSPVIARMLGVAEGQDSLFSAWFLRIHPDDQPQVRARWDRAIENAEEEYEQEFRLRHADGQWHWMQAHQRIFFEQGRAVRAIGVVQDITGRRAIDEAMRHLNANLEARVREEVAAREKAQRRAEQAERMQALGQLAGGIAHDFNNVLQAMMGALTLIERRGDDRAAVRRLVRLGSEAGERGASITRRLLGFARQAELRAESVDIAELLSGVSEILSHTLGAGITIDVAAAEGLRPAFVDRGQLETVVINLATNARDAMPGGGHLRLVAEPALLPRDETQDVVGLEPGEYVRLMVADNGAGMDAATLARAVEPFFTTKGVGEGTGLGLSMAKGLAEQSGGALSITSTCGQGTTVTLWLPVGAAAARVRHDAPASSGISNAGIAGRTLRVLIVDDQQHVRDVLGAQFVDAGFDVVVASGGQEAIEILNARAVIDLLITDLSMPGTDGLAVIEAAHQRYPRLPAILLTGYAGDDAALALKGALAGNFVLLRKPVPEDQLLERVRAMLAEPLAVR